MREDLIYRVWLSEATAERPALARRLLEEFATADGVWRAKPSEIGGLLKPDDPALRALFDKDLRTAGNIIKHCSQVGMDIISADEEEYPPLLKQIANPPLLLYLLGKMPDLRIRPAVTVVGPRIATAYGLFMAEKLGYQLARAGVVVVSGLAAGSDAAAHNGALNAEGLTLAVLAGGADVCYPPANMPLYRRILESGAIISELSPGSRGSRYSFPRRNRIMSGISYGTAVTETPSRSGALITASHALEQGRTVYAVPANVGRLSEGSNGLLKSGAIAVTEGSDIIADLLPQFSSVLLPELAAEDPRGGSLPEPAAIAAEENPYTDVARRIMEVLGDKPLLPDEIAQRTGIDISEISMTLTMLEIDGEVHRVGSGYTI